MVLVDSEEEVSDVKQEIAELQELMNAVQLSRPSVISPGANTIVGRSQMRKGYRVMYPVYCPSSKFYYASTSKESLDA